MKSRRDARVAERRRANLTIAAIILLIGGLVWLVSSSSLIGYIELVLAVLIIIFFVTESGAGS